MRNPAAIAGTAAWLAMLACPANAQFGPTQTLFRNSVLGWSGTLDVHGVASGSVAGPGGTTQTYSTDQHFSGNLSLNTMDPLTGAWVGTLDGAITVSESSTITFACTVTNTDTAGTTAASDFRGQPLKFNLSFDIGQDTWSLWPSNNSVNGTVKSDQTCAGVTQSSSAAQPLRFASLSMAMGFPFPASGFDLVGSHTVVCGGCGNAASNSVTYTFTYNLKAVTRNPVTVASNSVPVSNGANQALTFGFNAPAGYQTLDVVNVLINNVLDGRNACYLAYSQSANALYIVADNGDASQLSGKVMDGTGSVGNHQCSVALNGSSASGSGNTLTLALNLTFPASFAGNKVIYAAARDLSGNNSGWQTVGVHGVPPPPATFPNPQGMSPSSGSTAVATIAFSYQDQTSATNLQTVWALINTAIDGRAACYVAYYRPGNQVYLYPDNGDGSQATNMVLTGNNTVSNSQCTISAAGASVQTSGNTLTVTLPVAFKSAFSGFKGVWLAAQTLSNATSPWQALGAWVVPGQ